MIAVGLEQIKHFKCEISNFQDRLLAVNGIHLYTLLIQIPLEALSRSDKDSYPTHRKNLLSRGGEGKMSLMSSISLGCPKRGRIYF